MFDVLELKFVLVVVARLAVLVVGVSHSNTRRWSTCPSDLVLYEDKMLAPYEDKPW